MWKLGIDENKIVKNRTPMAHTALQWPLLKSKVILKVCSNKLDYAFFDNEWLINAQIMKYWNTDPASIQLPIMG